MTLSSLRRLVAAASLSGLAIAAINVPAKADVYTAFLANGESEVYEGYFLADEDIYASCDINCEDLNIYLFDLLTGELIESDTLADANPVVTAPYDGAFIVETEMVFCYADICEVWTDSDEGF